MSLTEMSFCADFSGSDGLTNPQSGSVRAFFKMGVGVALVLSGVTFAVSLPNMIMGSLHGGSSSDIALLSSSAVPALRLSTAPDVFVAFDDRTNSGNEKASRLVDPVAKPALHHRAVMPGVKADWNVASVRAGHLAVSSEEGFSASNPLAPGMSDNIAGKAYGHVGTFSQAGQAAKADERHVAPRRDPKVMAKLASALTAGIEHREQKAKLAMELAREQKANAAKAFLAAELEKKEQSEIASAAGASSQGAGNASRSTAMQQAPVAVASNEAPVAPPMPVPEPQDAPRAVLKDKKSDTPASASTEIALADVPVPVAPPARPDRSKAAAPDQNNSKYTVAYARDEEPEDKNTGLWGSFKKVLGGKNGGVMPARSSGIAVYDISSATVYLPSGEKLEAHSGLGRFTDDPKYVDMKNRGPTPPNVYRLVLRESLFHGVQAVRMLPVHESRMHGRDGILAHTYMLRGARGQSNGCVVFKNYNRFLEAFKKGQINTMIVVPELADLPKYMASV